MPDRGLPRWAQILGRGLALMTYLLCLTVAVADAAVPAPTISATLPAYAIAASSGSIALLASVGIVGVLAHRWRMEWIASSVLVFLLLARAVPTWATLGDEPTRLAAAAGMTLGAVAVGRRGFDMWVFWWKTWTVARGHRRRRHRRST